MNAKYQRFVQQYLIDLNATQAAIRAGYSKRTAQQQGSRLLLNVVIAAAIAKAQGKITEKLEITAERVLQEMARVAFADVRKLFREDGTRKPMRELDDETAAALGSIETVDRVIPGGEGRTEVVTKTKGWDKNSALQMLGKHLNLLTEKVEHTHHIALEKRIEAARKRLK